MPRAVGALLVRRSLDGRGNECWRYFELTHGALLVLLFRVQLLLAIPIVFSRLLQVEVLPRIFVSLRMMVCAVVVQANGGIHVFVLVRIPFVHFHDDGRHIVLRFILFCVY